jgi:hypothetical protein
MLRLAEVGIYGPLWSAGVLEELKRNCLESLDSPESYAISSAPRLRPCGASQALLTAWSV